eukprot:m.236372 g.236372  ORF g.236372 m.236372 type:complete len:51 (-) comp13921_c1_seq11:863-1015(-)
MRLPKQLMVFRLEAVQKKEFVQKDLLDMQCVNWFQIQEMCKFVPLPSQFR